jgi:hypothetical protein
MKRSMCGIALLAAATALWSCNGDPTGSIRDSGQKILADPTSVFVSQGESKFVTVELVDGQGNQLAAEFTPQNVGAGVTVVRDSTFLQTTTGTPIQTSERFIVNGITPVSTSFDVVSGGDSITVPVRVLPISFAPTFSNAAPVQNEAITITAPTGFLFASNAIISFGADTAVVVSRATDGTSFTFVPVPAFLAGTFVGTVSGALSDLFNTVPLSIPTVDSVAIPGIAAVPGTGAPGSAPNLNGPAAGTSSVIFDAGTFTAADITFDAGLGAQYYKVTITEAGDYKFITNWVGAAIAPDMDAILCSDATCSDGGASAGVTVGQPETGIFTLVPGTYYLAVVLLDGIAPPRISVQIDRL